MKRFVTVVWAAVALFASPVARSQDDAVMKALRDELARSVEQLQIEKLERPYFIAYRVQERSGLGVSASFGALLGSSELRTRTLTVEVRVGDTALDNSGFFSPSSGMSGMVRMLGGAVTLPLDDSYDELRRQIWLATDGAYKKALEDLSRKRAYLETKRRSDDAPDFSREEPLTMTDLAVGSLPKLGEAEAWVRQLSGVFREMPDVATSRISLSAGTSLTRYVNSEGSSFTRSAPLVSVVVQAATQAADGMPLEDSVASFGRSMTEIPGRDALAARVREMGARLKARREAPALDAYNGPVLFEDEAAAELLSQAFVPRLLATRLPLVDDTRYESMLQNLENPFLDRIGGRVLPELLSVTDNPLLSEHAGQPLLGGHKVDDEGARGRETRIVEAGILKTLLSTRSPVRGTRHSTGSFKGGGPQPANLIVSASGGRERADLRQELLRLAERRGLAFGVVVRRIANPALRPSRIVYSSTSMTGAAPSAVRVEPISVAYKMFADGREELVRVAEVSALTLDAFKGIVAASRDASVYTVPFRPAAMPFPIGFGGASGGDGVVSFVVPSLLFEEVNLKKPSVEIPLPPIAKHPFFDK